MVVALKPIYDAVGISAIVVATYQSVSGAGAKAIRELEEQTRAWCRGEQMEVKNLPRRIAFNVIPQIDVFTENGYTKEEMKMVNETRKIMHDPNIKVSATTVRVPVGRDEVFVGRIRKDLVFEPGLSMWVVADNIRKGAATNAVQIAELLIHAKA
jgi:aspartate-semialdehyde dehydrogenase